MAFRNTLRGVGQRASRGALIGRIVTLATWLQDQENVPWVSTWTSSGSSHPRGLPEPGQFRGLQAIVATKDSAGTSWQFIWASKRAADYYAGRLQWEYSLAPSRQYSVDWVEITPRSRWRRLATWGVLAAILASVATVLTNLDTINTSLVKMVHRPHVTLETTGKLQIDSSSLDHKDVVFLGDPFIRSTLSNVRVRLLPNGPAKDARSNLHTRAISLEGADHSVGASEHFTLTLPFDQIPPGQYVMVLTARVRSSWPWNNSSFVGRIPLDVRQPLAVRAQISELNPESPPGGRSDRAYVDLAFITGRLSEKSIAVRVDVPGSWTAWAVTEESTAVGAIDRLSQNTRSDPKDVVFIVRFSRVVSFSRQYIRLALQSPVPMTEKEWTRSVARVISDPAE